MRNYLKALGLALVAALALSAMAASAASAQEQGVLTTELGNDVTLTGEEIGEPAENQLTAFGSNVRCPGSKYTGHAFNVTPHGLIKPGATTTTITPHYKEENNNCQASTPFGPRPATIDMTGCDYVFHVGKTTPAENKDGTYGLTVDVECPPEQGIHVTVFDDNNHVNLICDLTVTEQTGLTGFHVTNTPPEDLHVSGTVHSIHVERTGLCTLDGKGTTTNTGEFDANVTVEAHEELGNPEGITISDEVI